MAFWIYIGVVALVFVVVFLVNLNVWNNFVGESLGYAFISTALAAFVLGVALGVTSSAGRDAGAEYKFVGDRTVSLKALDTASGVQGRSYYLGGGYLGTERVLNYMTKDADGYVRLASAPAWASAVKEDASAGEARVKIYDVEKRQDWLWPWPSSRYLNYEFRVPAGSVVEGYTVDNK